MRYNPSFYDDLKGKRFGRLTFISLAPRKKVGRKNVVMAKFQCDCGRVEERRLDGVVNSSDPMCAYCMKISRPCSKKNPLYGTWVGMMSRCYNPKSPSYRWYGANGIRICDEWKNLYKFSIWAKDNGWQKGFNIDRIDRNADYCPENCRIVTPKENQQNRSDNLMLTYNGETKCISEWERTLGFRKGRIQGRIRIGMTGNELFAKGRYRNDGSRKCETNINRFPAHLRIRQVPWEGKRRTNEV